MGPHETPVKLNALILNPDAYERITTEINAIDISIEITLAPQPASC